MQRQEMTKETSEAVYTFIREYIQTKKYSPTVREIGEGCYVSVRTVEKDRFRQDRNRSRG
jgi:SOS-response transcriptional repressor LexA